MYTNMKTHVVYTEVDLHCLPKLTLIHTFVCLTFKACSDNTVTIRFFNTCRQMHIATGKAKGRILGLKFCPSNVNIWIICLYA